MPYTTPPLPQIIVCTKGYAAQRAAHLYQALCERRLTPLDLLVLTDPPCFMGYTVDQPGKPSHLLEAAAWYQSPELLRSFMRQSGLKPDDKRLPATITNLLHSKVPRRVQNGLILARFASPLLLKEISHAIQEGPGKRPVKQRAKL